MRTKLILPLAMASLFTVGLSGCMVVVDKDGTDFSVGNSWNSDWEKAEKRNRAHIAQLQPGDSLKQVQSRMGVADFSEGFSRDGVEMVVLYYRTQRTAEDGKTSRDECTPLLFKQGQLIGWGEQSLQQI